MADLQIWLVFWPGFFLGILHTLLPCEDKTIFFFYAFGTSRDSKEVFKILTLYGLGLLLMNLIIGTLASVFGGLIFTRIDPNLNNALGAISIIITGVIMIIQVKRKAWNPHSQQKGEIKETFKQQDGKVRKRTSLLLGFLAGLPPCIFEVAIYLQAISFSGSAGIINGIAVVFFFGIGTWLGLFPLAAFGLIGPLARNKLSKRRSSSGKKEHGSSKAGSINALGDAKPPYIELISASILILLGIILLILALAGINIFTWPTPEV